MASTPAIATKPDHAAALKKQAAQTIGGSGAVAAAHEEGQFEQTAVTFAVADTDALRRMPIPEMSGAMRNAHVELPDVKQRLGDQIDLTKVRLRAINNAVFSMLGDSECYGASDTFTYAKDVRAIDNVLPLASAVTNNKTGDVLRI